MRTYEQLTGAKGRKVFYRAERFRADHLFKDIVPAVDLGGDRAALKDVSMTGLAAQSGELDYWDGRLGDEIPVRLCIADDTLYEGSGRIRRIEPSGVRTTVAVELTSGYIDIPTIVTGHDHFLLSRALADPQFGAATNILPEYQELTAEIIYLFRSYKDLLARFEDRLGDMSQEDRQKQLHEALIACEDKMVPQWKELWYRGNDITFPMLGDPIALAEHKRYTEQVLTPDFMPGPVMRRCYEKPLGYPGDYQIMNYVYRWEKIGETPYEKLLHRIGIETGECVGTRLRMTQKFINEKVGETPGSQVMNITNLGCGSAYEVSDFLKINTLPRPVNFTLIDQDHDALSYAYEHAHPQVVRHGGNARIQCLQASFAQLLKAGSLFNSLPPQDMIYSLGLYDYLSARRARALTHELYNQLAPGGYMVLANVKVGRETCMWPLEFITDWSLVYRTADEMWDMVDGLDCERISLEEDKTKCVYVMTVRKPAA
jgi:extracellular factor (EF) 3-hydroxypalmitic acid methyl ester biosynthesis protein